MKKVNELSPVVVYRNNQHEENTKRELEQARQSLQTVFSLWGSLDLVPCTNIFKLISNPEKVYFDAVNELAVIPVTVGRFQLSKEAFINNLDIPIPDALYKACKVARMQPHCSNSELWSIEGDQVIINETEADNLINSQNIIADTKEKIQLAKDITDYVELTNRLSEKLGLLDVSQIASTFYRGKFRVTQKEYPGGLWSIELIPDTLRTWLNK